MGTRIGVLALQGAVQAHRDHLEAVGVTSIAVKQEEALQTCDALIIPGGESTAMSKLLDTSGLRQPIADRIAEGMPVLGTCAGLILLAKTVQDRARDGHPKTFAVLDVSVCRNAYGRQNESFEAILHESSGDQPFPGIFIRAPRIVEVGTAVRIRAEYGGDPVWVSQGTIHAASFHPELTEHSRVHRQFVEEAV